MQSKHEETSVKLGISIPIVSYNDQDLSREDPSTDNQQPDVLVGFSNLAHSLDPNLGIMGQLPSSDISHEKSILNPWNIEPHFLHILPVSTSTLSENSILIFGGLNPSSISRKIPPDIDNDDFVLGSTIFQYMFDHGIWKYYGTMFEPRCYHACALDGQYLYITGGYSLLKRKNGEMIAISSTDRLNLIDRQWKSCTNMITPRAAHALISHKGYLYAFGGRSSQGSILASVEMYDPHQDLWIEITSLPRPAMGLSATCIMDSIWLIGGITDHVSKDPAECLLSNVFSFVPSAKKWYEEVPLPYACAFSSCISNDYSLWVIGGCTASRNSVEENIMKSCSTVLQLLLTEKPKWQSVASLSYPRHALTAVLHGEYIFVLGGIESASKCTSDKVEVINIIGNISAVCSKMPVPIAGCTSVLIVKEKTDYRHIEEENDAFSVFSQRMDFKSDSENYYSSGSSKISNSLEDGYNINRNKYLSPISLTSKTHAERFAEKFIKTTEKIEIPVTKECFAEVPYVQSIENLKYRTSMEIILDFDETGPYAMKKQQSQALKWLNYLKKISSSDEKLHKDIFRLEEPKLNLKTENVSSDMEKSLKSTEVKYFERDRNSDRSDSAHMQSSSPSQHKSFMYVESNIKAKSIDINLDQKLEKKEETLEDTIILDISDLKSDNLYNDTPEENKITINEDRLPIILLIGGEYSKQPIDSRFILMYHCNEDMWEKSGSMLPEYRSFHAAVFVKNKIYVIGGFKSKSSKFDENITNKVIYYDICDKHWRDTANINDARAHHSAVVLHNKIYILGGRNQSGQIISSVEVYDESCDTWEKCQSLPYPVLGAAIFSQDDSIHIYGGITYDDGDNEIISSNVAIFDAKKNSWTLNFDMPIPLAFCGIIKHLNSVWLFGGLKVEDDDLISSKDIFKFDTVTETWTKIAELSIARLGSVIVSLGAKVYVIGGYSTQERKEVLTCERVDLANNGIFLLKDLPIGVSGKAGIAIKEVSYTENK